MQEKDEMAELRPDQLDTSSVLHPTGEESESPPEETEPSLTREWEDDLADPSTEANAADNASADEFSTEEEWEDEGEDDEEQVDEPPRGEGPEKARSEIRFDNDRTTSESLLQIGQLFVELSSRQAHVFKAPRALLERTQSVFVPPVGLSANREAELLAYGSRIFVVHGPRLSGRLTTCFHLALMLQEAGKVNEILLYRHPLEGAVPFAHYAQTNSLPKRAVLIPEAPLEDEVGNIDRWDLSLDAILTSRNSYLLLRSERPPQRFGDSRAASIDSRVEDLQRVFEKHLDYSFSRELEKRPSEEVGLIRQWSNRWKEVADLFDFPSQVDRFSLHITELKIGIGKDQLRIAAKKAARPRVFEPEEARAWFRALTPNERLFALLLSLFQGIPRDLVEEIYVESVKSLRRDGVTTLCDPREMSFRDLLEAAKANEHGVIGDQAAEDGGEGGILFDDRLCGEAALLEIGNHLPLLRSLSDPFIELIERYSDGEHWRLRKALAEALGRIGAWRFDELFKIVDRLVQSPALGARVMAGNVLGLAFGSDPQVLLARERKLDKWIESGNPDEMFIAGAALWRVFDSFSSRTTSERSLASDRRTQDALFRILRKLIEYSSQFNHEAQKKAMSFAQRTSPNAQVAKYRFRRILKSWRQKNLASVAYALRMIVRVDPAVVVRNIQKWSEEKEQKQSLRLALRLATKQIFLQESEGKGLPTMERLGPLVELVKFVLTSAEEHRETLAPMMRALAIWCQEKDRREYVQRSLLEIANGVDRSAAQALRVLIAEYWLEEKDPEVQKLGTALISRTVAIEGFPSELPGVSRCLLLVDTSVEAISQDAPRLMARLKQLLGAVVDVMIVPLGTTTPFMGVAEGATFVPQPVVSARPRLMMPALERQDQAQVSSVLVLSWGDVVDLEDSISSPWASRLLVATAGSKREYSRQESRIILSMGERITDRDLATIELQLNLLRARQLAAMPSALWRPHLAKCLGIDLDDQASLESTLRTRIVDLEDPGSMAAPSGSRLILCALLWLGLEDINACCALLKRWLPEEARDQESQPPPDLLLRVFGEAGACMLFRLFACSDPLPRPESHSCLFGLADRLVHLSWSSVAVVLLALRCWLEDEGWRTLLTGGNQRGWLLAWLERVAERHHTELNGFLEIWRAPLESRLFPGVGAPPTAVLALADAMALKIALARSAPLPSLAEGRRYGVVVVGSDCDDEPLRWKLAQLAMQVVDQGRKQWGDLVWLVYRCGRSRPVIVVSQEDGGHANFADRLFHEDEAQRPELLVPLLTLQDPAQVHFVLLLQTVPILDELDLATSPWPRLLHSYSLLELEARVRRSGAWPLELELKLKKAIEQRAQFIVQELAQSHPSPPVGVDSTGARNHSIR